MADRSGKQGLLAVISVLAALLTIGGMVLTCIALGTTNWISVEVKVSEAIPSVGLAAGATAIRVVASMFKFTRYLYPDSANQVISTYWFFNNRYAYSYSMPNGVVFSPWWTYSSATAIFSLNILALFSMCPMLFATFKLTSGARKRDSSSFGLWAIFTFVCQLCAICTVYTTYYYQTYAMGQLMNYVYVYPIARTPTTSESSSEYSVILFNISFAIFGFLTIFVAPIVSALTRRLVREQHAKQPHHPAVDPAQVNLQMNPQPGYIMQPAYPAQPNMVQYGVPQGVPLYQQAPQGYQQPPQGYQQPPQGYQQPPQGYQQPPQGYQFAPANQAPAPAGYPQPAAPAGYPQPAAPAG